MSLFSVVYTQSRIKWQKIMEDFQIFIGLFNKVKLIIFDGMTKEWSIAAYLLAKQMYKIYCNSGILFLVLYLKQCSSSLMTAYGGDRHRPELLPVFVSLTRLGYPRIIPSFHRRVIYERTSRSDCLVKFYLSMFSLYRALLVAKRISRSTFQSITSPVGDMSRIMSYVDDMRMSLPSIIARYMPAVWTIPLKQGITFVPTYKSLPNTQYSNHVLAASLEHPEEFVKVTSIFSTFTFEMAAYFKIMYLQARVAEMSQGRVTTSPYNRKNVSSGGLWVPYVRYALDDLGNHLFSKNSLEKFERTLGPQGQFLVGTFPRVWCGRLAQTVQKGGSRRIFAIGNYRNQRLLYPLHEWLMECLRWLPMDGTFDQALPMRRLKGSMTCHSVDLSSATDRFPLALLYTLIEFLFDPVFASSVVNSALAYSVFVVPFVRPNRKGQVSEVAFRCGQPLGYLSSWPLFALTHHFVVWRAAEKVYPGKIFTGYAVLGDDVVIVDDAVAREYIAAIDELQIQISYQKSLVSHTGCGEFAKRFLTRGLDVDLSPVSVSSILSTHHPYGLIGVYDRYGSGLRFSTLCRLYGKSYRVLGSLGDNCPKFERGRMSKSVHRLALVILNRNSSFKPSGLSWWLGRGLPLHPYIKGRMLSLLQDRMSPKDVQPAPSVYYSHADMEEFAEYTVLRNWVSQWSNYLRWYWTTLWSYQCTLEQALNGPVLVRKFHRTLTDENLVKFGLMYFLYERVPTFARDAECGWALPLSTRFGIVDVNGVAYVQGGQFGTDSLVLLADLASTDGKFRR